MSTNDEHLRLLSIFHYVVAGLAALFACIPVIHLVLGIMMLVAPERMAEHGKPQDEQALFFMGVFFTLFASAFILAGWSIAACIAFAGRFLAQRRRYTYCLVMAAIECMFMPFGTVLGVFTIILLIKPEVKQTFT